MHTLSKAERLNRQKIIKKMFEGGGSSFSVFPLRVVYMTVSDLDAPASVLISVSKRRFKRAVRRNRVKRQIREAYRKHKPSLLALLSQKGTQIAVAFIYLANELIDSSVIEARMETALIRIAEKLS